MTTIEILEKECEENGITILAVARHANIPKDTVFNWRKKEPTTLVTLQKLKDAINDLKAINKCEPCGKCSNQCKIK